VKGTLLKEIALAGPEHLDAAYVASYDRKAGFDPGSDLAVLRVEVECVHAGFLSYEHDGDPPQFMYTRNALHHLPDFWKGVALSRMAALLAPGGTLQVRDLVFSFDLTETEAGIEAWLRSAVDRPEDGSTREELETHLRDEYSTFTWLLEPMIERAGLEIAVADDRAAGVYANYVCVKAR
jgi:hypothetical protein